MAERSVEERSPAQGLLWLACYIGSIFAANWTLQRYGFVPVGFGLRAPAGVYFAGAAFTFRDLVHRSIGRAGTIGAILVGAVLSWWVEPSFAVASGVAFGLSELADLAVYEPLWRRRWLLAVAASNAVGLVVDSALFLWLAFGSLAFIEGQIVGKAWMTLAAIGALWIWRRVRFVCTAHGPLPRGVLRLHRAKCPARIGVRL